jgi:hypothetical protein
MMRGTYVKICEKRANLKTPLELAVRNRKSGEGTI